MLFNDDFKKDVQSVQESIIKALQYSSKLLMSTLVSDERINEWMDELTAALESGCVTARAALEKYRPPVPFDLGGGQPLALNEVAGSAEVTPERWVHIRLGTLLPHCKYKTSAYLRDTITRLLAAWPGELPKYERAFLAIVEHCNIQNRQVFDQDNKGWKQIPNALKGVLFDDDDQFHLSLGLFSVRSDEPACYIYVMPIEAASDFLFSLNAAQYYS